MSSQYIGTDADAPVTAVAEFKDAAGNVVAPDDIPIWASSDPTIAQISSTNADGTEASVAFAGRAGSCTITCTSINREGTKIVLSGSVVISAGDAVQGSIDFPSTAVPAEVPPSDPTAPSTSAQPADATTATTADASASSDSGTSAPAPDASGSPADPAAADQSSSAPASVG